MRRRCPPQACLLGFGQGLEGRGRPWGRLRPQLGCGRRGASSLRAPAGV